jgi:peroxiredoxin
MNRTAAATFALIASIGLSAAAQSAAPAFELPDVNGTTHTLGQYAGKIVVLEWTNYDCPFVRKFYGPGAMQALQKKYTGNDVVWLSICSSAPGKQGHFTPAEWNRRIKEAGTRATAVLLDESGEVGHAYGASNTPHLFVVGPDGQLAYQGAVDDQRTADPATVGKGLNYLEEALDALIAGKPVPEAQTKAYGCSVKY